MKYHVISISNDGHGAIFTNAKEAKEYQKKHPDSTCRVTGRLPSAIPPVANEQVPLQIPKDQAQSITVYTDGSSLNNPGPGGYGVIIIIDGKTYEHSQGYEHTTNNRMEMMAVITALENLTDHKEAAITIHSDSQYTINGITKGWAKSWRKRNWKKVDGKPALNPDLWKNMLHLTEQFPRLSFKWVKGHAGDPLNERADELANTSAQGYDKIIDEGYSK